MMEIKNGKIYIAPGMVLMNKKTGKPLTEKEYSEARNEAKNELRLR